MPRTNVFNLPFDEAIKYFEQKIKLPTERWTDLMGAAHSRAFVVAGATKQELLADFQASILKALQKGTTLTEFRKDFDQMVEKHGWSYNGKRGWRTGVIYDTNLRTAYAAGHYEQMKTVAATRPYWRYIGGLSEHPRPLHLSWSGTVLPHDDAWWETHFPPNGWGCKCKVVSHSKREIERDGHQIAETAPDDGKYQWENPGTGETINVPAGIDPGWDYNPGQAAWGSKPSQKVMDAWQGGQAWEPLPGGKTYLDYKRPESIPLDRPGAALDHNIKTPADMKNALKSVLGGEEKIFSFQAGNFRYDINANAENLANHLKDKPDRGPYIPFLAEAVTDPYEVWLAFEKNRLTGKVALRQRIIKAIATGEKEGMVIVTNAVAGQMEAWTIIPAKSLKYLGNQRWGKLIWSR